ncbi:MAG: diacylglycerol kinase family lipid kinase [Planctomycetes bacterium]|jgi:YegS/Rv2252/BmrU family lipid kinase|nr:diacylglycerol kinase family lipid kinase [Planctomycetota bacterium]MBT4559856.1 diacylglycerol kinase family lipid kinase [Planctomycetota bacterium]MBT5101142.1 diacylglycerol kinase family lipid kinase [Planctomycetota bacterium]MBT7318363.1 diacylglycerol kinase family lipid kinase [Planctomycetota bacterium]
MFLKPAVIVNPRSAAGRTGRAWRKRQKDLLHVFPNATIEKTACVGDAANLSRTLLIDGHDLIIAVGGDGTLNEVANGFFMNGRNLFPESTIALLPSGTGSDYAKGLGLSNDFQQALNAIQQKAIQCVDVGRLVMSQGEPSLAGDPFHAGTERYFLNEVGTGMSVKVVERVNAANKFFGGRLTFLWHTFRALLTWKNIGIQIKTDDNTPCDYCINSIIIASGRFTGGGMTLAPHASPLSGSFAYTVFADLPRVEAVLRLLETYRGVKLVHPQIHYGEARQLAITTPGLILETDGEIAGPTPAQIEIIPASLRFAGVSF